MEGEETRDTAARGGPPRQAEDPASGTAADAIERARQRDVLRVALDGREFLLIGTAHISRESFDLVRAVIEAERPDAVCI